MDVREKLVEICFHEFCMVAGDSPCGCDGCPYGKYGSENGECYEAYKKHKLEELEKAGVTVQEWISVDDELPQYTDEYNAIVGVASEFGYFEKVTTLRFERIKGKEPRWVMPKNEIYNVISWMSLPQPPKGE